MWPVAKRIYFGKGFSDFAVDHDREFYRRYTGFGLIPPIDPKSYSMENVWLEFSIYSV